LYLDASKENAQAFDSVHIISINEGVKDALKNGVWVICLNALKESTVKFGTDLDEDSDSDNDCENFLEQCKLCLLNFWRYCQKTH
jgi:hypothetical protein